MANEETALQNKDSYEKSLGDVTEKVSVLQDITNFLSREDQDKPYMKLPESIRWQIEDKGVRVKCEDTVRDAGFKTAEKLRDVKGEQDEVSFRLAAAEDTKEAEPGDPAKEKNPLRQALQDFASFATFAEPGASNANLPRRTASQRATALA